MAREVLNRLLLSASLVLAPTPSGIPMQDFARSTQAVIPELTFEQKRTTVQEKDPRKKYSPKLASHYRRYATS